MAAHFIHVPQIVAPAFLIILLGYDGGRSFFLIIIPFTLILLGQRRSAIPAPGSPFLNYSKSSGFGKPKALALKLDLP